MEGRPGDPATGAALRVFLRACRPEWRDGELQAALRKLARVQVLSLKTLLEQLRLGSLNQRLEEAGLRRFSAETLQRFRLVAGLQGPEAAVDGPAANREEAGGGGVQEEAAPLREEQAPPETECAICFEPVSQVAALPCACKVDYCMQCWDRALSQSFQKCSVARCPTCRSQVRVDFSHDRLVFSRETEVLDEAADPDAAAEYFERTLTRISDQVRPAQIRLLRDYGAVSREAVEARSGRAAWPGRGYGAARSEGGSPRLPESMDARGVCDAVERCVLEEAVSPPKCVCGGALSRIPAEERSRAAGAFKGPDSSASELGRIFARILEQQHQQEPASIVCDLCEEEVPREASVWMCENGDRTIKHATEYDICDACFASCIA